MFNLSKHDIENTLNSLDLWCSRTRVQYKNISFPFRYTHDGYILFNTIHTYRLQGYLTENYEYKHSVEISRLFRNAFGQLVKYPNKVDIIVNNLSNDLDIAFRKIGITVLTTTD